mmetsp:Transcript_53020/g.152787  ORF Transcript_53020/g.152787 Transcript_53020/m.152787 type:complete len:206 (-) Transcript_53020:793-1410(-)
MASNVAKNHGPHPEKKQVCPKRVINLPQTGIFKGYMIVSGMPIQTAPTVNTVRNHRMMKVHISPQRARQFKRPVSVNAPPCFSDVSSQPMVHLKRCFQHAKNPMGANSPERDSAQNSMFLPSRSCWIAISTSSVWAVVLNSFEPSTAVLHKAFEPEKYAWPMKKVLVISFMKNQSTKNSASMILARNGKVHGGKQPHWFGRRFLM